MHCQICGRMIQADEFGWRDLNNNSYCDLDETTEHKPEVKPMLTIAICQHCKHNITFDNLKGWILSHKWDSVYPPCPHEP